MAERIALGTGAFLFYEAIHAFGVATAAVACAGTRTRLVEGVAGHGDQGRASCCGHQSTFLAVECARIHAGSSVASVHAAVSDLCFELSGVDVFGDGRSEAADLGSAHGCYSCDHASTLVR